MPPRRGMGKQGETRRDEASDPVGRSLVFSFISLTSSFPSLANQPTERTNKNSTSTTPTAPPGSAPPSWEPTTASSPRPR